MSNIEVVGIGTNLSCFNGILPNQNKLIQLSLYKQLIEAIFNHKMLYVSAESFKLDYIKEARILNSKYIEKVITNVS